MKMKRSSTFFLKSVLLLVAGGALTLMIVLPQYEGRNVGASYTDIYLRDPFLAFCYLGSVPFFLALHHAYRLLGYIERNRAFSRSSVMALRYIKYCAVAVVGFILSAISFIRLTSNEDSAGIVALGALITFTALVIATAAAVFERLFQSAVDIKSENDLTV
jgi:hypothetical protein